MKPLDILIRCLSAATWHLSAIRCRWQCEHDHAEAERRLGEMLGRRNLTDDQRAMIADAVAEIESKLALKETAANARKAKDGASLAAVVQPKRTRAKTAKATVGERSDLTSVKKLTEVPTPRDQIAALQCPACFAEFGLPPGIQPPLCPACREATLAPRQAYFLTLTEPPGCRSWHGKGPDHADIPTERPNAPTAQHGATLAS